MTDEALVAKVITSARRAHDHLDQLLGAHHHSLGAAVRHAQRNGTISASLSKQLYRLQKSSDVVRHATTFAIDSTMQELLEVEKNEPKTEKVQPEAPVPPQASSTFPPPLLAPPEPLVVDLAAQDIDPWSEPLFNEIEDEPLKLVVQTFEQMCEFLSKKYSSDLAWSHFYLDEALAVPHVEHDTILAIEYDEPEPLDYVFEAKLASLKVLQALNSTATIFLATESLLYSTNNPSFVRNYSFCEDELEEWQIIASQRFPLPEMYTEDIVEEDRLFAALSSEAFAERLMILPFTEQPIFEELDDEP